MSYTPLDFLLRALPWPDDNSPGYINIHAMLRLPGIEGRWTGYPTRGVHAFWQKVQWCLSWTHPPDLYMCMSRQAQTRPDGRGNEKATKSWDNALAFKGIWADFDVKETAYKTVGDAFDHLKTFCEFYKILPPTAIVSQRRWNSCALDQRPNIYAGRMAAIC